MSSVVPDLTLTDAASGGATLTDSSLTYAPVSAAPVAAAERYELMDILRGFALFGVLAANMRGFNLPLSAYASPEKLFPGRIDIAVQFLLDWFISGKAYSMFAFLFGLGFAIQMTRAQTRTSRFPWFYLRRIAALALFGVLHGLLIWNGDILLPYAIAAFLLFWFRKAKLKTVGWWVVSLWGLILSAITTLFIVIHTPLADRFHGHIGLGGHTSPSASEPQVVAIYRHGNVAQVVRETALLWTGNQPPTHLHKWAWLQGVPQQDIGISILSFTFFLLGLYVWRKGVLQELDAWRPRLRRICQWTLPIGVAAHLIVGISKAHPKFNAVAGVDWSLTMFQFLGMPVMACGYATLLALLFSGRHPVRIAWLAPAGRMALTNYLTQSVVCVAFYSGIVTGTYGRVGPAWDMVASVVLFAAQVAFSHWWLGRFRFGPAEWAWRALTYGKLPPLRIESAGIAT